jgi:hypothetical protein
VASNFYPLPHPVKAIGVPYQGTHARAFNKSGGSDNWESENAVDLPTPKGTPVYAVEAGTIGKQIGPMGSGRFAGNRLHLVTAGNEFYYAHLSKLVVKAGQTVHAGQLLGYSGVANGVPHLHIAAKVGDPRAAFGSDLATDTGKAPKTAATQTADQAHAPFDVQGVAPPNATPPPTALGVPGPDVQLPGSVDYTVEPHNEQAALWGQVAQGDLVSPETQAMVRNAQLSSGV